MSAGHTHDHDGDDHGHEHPAAPMVEEITDYEILEIAVRELAIERGLFTAEDHRRFTEWAESIGPINGSRLVAKAWTDPAFKARVLEDGVKACKELGLDWAEPTGFGTPSDYTNFIALVVVSVSCAHLAPFLFSFCLSYLFRSVSVSN